ncbi:leukemia inhibitory factor receptor-like isoform X2 [Labeo rohita]|uniref:Leukemia inhibitory factor receptor-like isoform X2 n=1 Tax=Labeo rohita TaxID=84645 RepID=A0A498N597_LABRO|nr:leukemia inhibitory factor receptor-like isoform X2 [Labeo rohita]
MDLIYTVAMHFPFGKDLNATTTGVYPQHKPVMVGSNITFCCIVERDQVPLPKFLIQISNRTYISDPVHFDEPRVSAIHCGGWKGSMVFIGYPPDDQNLVCVTRDLSSVECNWNVGRNTHLTHNRKTNYTLNGRNCEPGNCNQHALMKQKTKWTLIAKNPLGVKTLIDEADPTERVWLRAPSKISHIANARNVTLRWSWDEKNYTLFLMICQVKLNGNIYNKTFNGVGLSSAVLVNLQPFADYTAQVTCGSLEHFYKWGDWSEITKFSTKEDRKDLNPTTTGVYPNGKTVMVGSNITFCCIVERDEVPLSTFPIQISNRTYISNPVHYDKPPDQIPYSEISCGIRKGSIVFIGYPPDDQNLVCVTRDLSSVECNWNVGRNTHLTHNRKTNYTLNGRNCEPGNCNQHALMKQKTKWTLIAKNPLGVKTLIDEADPTERVWLRAPSKISHIANARNVTLRWSWDEKNYASFLMICQVKLNGNIYTKTFNGVGLSSAVLVNLQPFANYTAQVTCGSLEHFYKWGDWSEITKFSTKEDIPEAVDVWIQYSEQKASVMWKPLTQEQSHGTITGYEITIENAEGGSTKSNIGLNNNKQLCYNITFGSEKNVTVSAKNSVGLSPPSTIIIQSNPDNEVSVSRINSSDGGFEISWEESHSSTCGYVVEWFPTYNKTQCSVKWKKIPECERDACYTRIQSGCQWQAMEVGTVVQEEMKFRGAEFAVKVELAERLLMVEISDVVTADQWRGEFDPAYIEDLTRKTGNFKQFPVFCSMLESAVNKSSESVTLDLLTYSDLELLRNRKAGVVGRPRAQPQSPALSAKRYLILIYTVEFDRIHYPLPLPYLGKPDPAELQREIRALRLALVRDEKEALAKALDRLQMVGAGSTPGARGLREAVHSLEEQLLKERAKSQRSASKRSQEQRLLLEQLEELRASERALRIRVKSLTTELALLRRGRATPVMSGRSGLRGDGEVHRSLSREHSLTRVGATLNLIIISVSSDDQFAAACRLKAAGKGGSAFIMAWSRVPRFDPTAYIQDRQRRQKEAEMKKGRKLVYNGPPVSRVRHMNKKPMCSTPSQRMRAADTSIDTGADLSEIDARLQALQDYMRDLDTGH